MYGCVTPVLPPAEPNPFFLWPSLCQGWEVLPHSVSFTCNLQSTYCQGLWLTELCYAGWNIIKFGVVPPQLDLYSTIAVFFVHLTNLSFWRTFKTKHWWACHVEPRLGVYSCLCGSNFFLLVDKTMLVQWWFLYLLRNIIFHNRSVEMGHAGQMDSHDQLWKLGSCEWIGVFWRVLTCIFQRLEINLHSCFSSPHFSCISSFFIPLPVFWLSSLWIWTMGVQE